MTAERDGKNRRTGQPDLLASLPNEQPAPGIDPAAVEELLTGVRDLREQVAGLREAVSADRPASLREAVPEEAVPQALTPEALDAWSDSLVARVAEAARTEAAAKEDAAAAHLRGIEEAAAKAAAAAERIDGGLDSTAERVAAEIKEAVTTIRRG